MRTFTPARQRRSAWLVAFVSVISLALTACGGGGDDESGAADGVTDGVVRVVGQDNLTWSTEEVTVQAGTVEFELVCEDAVNHNLVIEELDEEVAACAPGETASGEVELEPGTYTYVCTVPGHESTMRGELVVE